MLEHYGIRFPRFLATAEADRLPIVDGDLVNESTPVGREEAGPDNLHVWGPPLPATFLE